MVNTAILGKCIKVKSTGEIGRVIAFRQRRGIAYVITSTGVLVKINDIEEVSD